MSASTVSPIKVAEPVRRGRLDRWLASRRYEIVDRSMEPALTPGDRVLVDRGAYRREAPRIGDVVAAVDPTDGRRWLVKRVSVVGPGEASVPVDAMSHPYGGPRVGVPAGTVFLLSDSIGRGRDSRHFGPVSLEDLRGRVWYRYSPAGVRGRIGRAD